MRLAAVLLVGCLVCAPAGSAVSRVTQLHACVRTDGSLGPIRAYEPVCKGSEQIVSWTLDK
jgi:hypothetical protein